MSIDWKAEYLKSVESGCITLDELREARAELAAIKQALAAQQDHEPENEPHVSLASVQEPVAWLVEFENGEQELHFDKQSVGETQAPLYTTPPVQPAPVQPIIGSYLEKDNSQFKFSDYELDGVHHNKPAVPDAFGTREGEHPQYIQGWNDCRQAMLEMMK